MELELWRLESDGESTLGILFINGVFECFILEDEYRAVKEAGETRIPSGPYQITLRKEGGMHPRYADRYGDMHKGMLWIRNVANFSYCYFHTGVRDDDTAGCLLVGTTILDRNLDGNGEMLLGRSRDAYRKFYPKVAKMVENGRRVNITIKDMDRQCST